MRIQQAECSGPPFVKPMNNFLPTGNPEHIETPQGIEARRIAAAAIEPGHLRRRANLPLAGEWQARDNPGVALTRAPGACAEPGCAGVPVHRGRCREPVLRQGEQGAMDRQACGGRR